MKKEITGILLFLVIMWGAGYTTYSQSKTYYISDKGDDYHTGLTKRTAWKTMERINRVTFQPGDAILFESGGTWNGTLHPLGSGTRENTFLQVSGPWKPSIDIRSDVAIVYGAADSPNMTLKERVQTWKDRGYITQFMTGISWGDSYNDYFYGRWDGKNHLDEAQVARQGDTLWHGRQTPYFLPSMNFLKYFKENHIKKAIDAGAKFLVSPGLSD